MDHQEASQAAPRIVPMTVFAADGARPVQPRAVHGWFSRVRWAMVWLTQAVFHGLPWLLWNGRQAVLCDLRGRRLFLFDRVLGPEDSAWLLGLLALGAGGLCVLTMAAGRLWCGYACPQTVYASLFRAVERCFEGGRDASPGQGRKLWRTAGKHAVWLALGIGTGFSAVGYFTPIRTLWAEASTLAFGPWEWAGIGVVGLVTYGNAGFMRERICKSLCPYARLQRLLFDRDTLIVSYDAARGEPRGRRAPGGAWNLGSCVDCGLCVQACPAGIDIREGLRVECIACAACIDACDHVMERMRLPGGLIRYATPNELEQRLGTARMFERVLRPRVLVGAAMLLALAVGLSA